MYSTVPQKENVLPLSAGAMVAASLLRPKSGQVLWQMTYKSRKKKKHSRLTGEGHMAVFVKENVFRLKIAVDDAERVQVA
jgi:hypothetical protein